MRLTIKSKKLGRTLEFSRPGSGYVYVDMNGQQGSLGNQICDNGAFIGSTISYEGDDEAEFNAVCRQWYRAYVRHIDWMSNQ